MTLFRDLVAAAMLPGELPPPFWSRPLSRIAGGESFSLLKLAKNSALLGIHNLAKPGSLRRRLGIPNPVAFVPLVREIARAWPELDRLCGASKLSMSRPVHTQRRRRQLEVVVY